MKVGRLLHRRLPRAELVAARETAIDAKKIRAPRLAVGRREAIERRERNADHRLYDVLRAANPLKEIAARPSDIRLHRGAIAVRRIDGRVERRPERIDLDLEVAADALRREKNLDDVFL